MKNIKNKNKFKTFFTDKSKKRKLFFGLLIILIIVALFFWNRAKKQEVEFSEHQLTRQDISQTMLLSGNLDAKERVNLNFAGGGKLVYLGAKTGDWVNKWQTIATIDTRDLQKNLEKNLNYYENTRLDWDAQLKEDEGEVLDDDEKRARKKEQNLMDNSVLDVELTSVAVDGRVMSAPFAGILLSSPTPVTGVVLSPSDVFELVNPKTLIIKAEIDEIDLPLISLGQTAKIIFNAYAEEEIMSQIDYIAFKSMTGSTGTVFQLELPLAGVEDLNKYRIGMNVDVEIELARKSDVLVVPLEAIFSQEGQTMVKVKNPNQVTPEDRVIKLGLENDEMAEVIEGLEEGEIILIES